LCVGCCAAGAEEPNPLAEADRNFQRALEIWGDGKSQEAETLLNRALAIRQGQLGSNDPKVAEVIERLGALSYNRGKFAEAEVRFRKALDIDVQEMGERSVAVAYVMGDLGAALREEHRYPEAEAIVERSLALRRELLPPNDLSIAGSLNNLGRIYLGERRFSDARQSLEESLRIYVSSLPPDHPRIREDQVLLQRVDNAGARDRNLRKVVLLSWGAALASLAGLVGCNLWSERRHITNPSNRPRWVKALGIASFVGLFGSVGFLGAFATDWFLLTVMPSIDGESSTLRNLGKLGSILGIWLSTIALQILTNAGRWAVGLPTHPIAYLRWSAARAKLLLSDGGVTPGTEIPVLECTPSSARWFAAMEYYALILNRTYKVFVTEHTLCGARVRGLVSNPMIVSPQMFRPDFWTQTRSAQIYDCLDVTSDTFLRVNSANFQIKWHQIAEIEYRAGMKWGMGNVPHSGRLILHLRSGKLRELVLLGEQNGNALKERLDQFVKADATPVVGV
jgi:tetratricopeptide (TPR) repeat protein